MNTVSMNRVKPHRPLKLHKPLVLFASPHPNGATAALLAAYLLREGIERADCTFFDCYALRPEPCVDCGYCREHPACAFHDLDDFYEALEAADRLILAAPVYNGGFPAPMKAVIDRLQVYFNARFVRGVRPPIAQEKRAALLLTSGSAGEKRTALLPQLLPCFTVIHAEMETILEMPGTDVGWTAEQVAALVENG